MKTVLKNNKSCLLTAVLCAASFCLYAQKSTELYIPCGKSPGVSGKYSVMGKVEMLKAGDSTITIRQETGIKSMRFTAATIIYLDKSKLKLQNKKGSWADIKPGMMAEAKYKDNKPGGPVEWIKVQIE
jgi:hypothetical protein